MKIIIVVHMMLDLQFYSTFGQQTPQNGKNKIKIKIPDSNQYLSMVHDGFKKYLGVVLPQPWPMFFIKIELWYKEN